MEQEKIDQLASLLKEIVRESKDDDPTVENFQYVDFAGDIDGKGFIWTGSGYNKQFIFTTKPDRFFISENVDLARDKHLSINNLPVITQSELGTSITKSSLREVGRLKGLIVDGALSVNNYLYFIAIQID